MQAKPPQVRALVGDELILMHQAMCEAVSQVRAEALDEQRPEVERHVFRSGAPYSRAFTLDGTCHYKRGRTTASEPPFRNGRNGPSLLCGGNGRDGGDDGGEELAEQAGRIALELPSNHSLITL